MLCWDFRILPGILLQWFCSVSYLRPAASVDVHADGTVGAAAAHEEMSPVVGLHHSDEVPTAVLEKQTQKKTKQQHEKWKRSISEATWQSNLIWEDLWQRLIWRSDRRHLGIYLWHDRIRVANEKTLFVAFLHFFHYGFMNSTKCYWGSRRDGTSVWDKPTGTSGKGRKLIGWTLLACWQQTSCVCAFVSLNSTHFCLPVGCQRVWKSESDGTISRWMGWNLRNPHNKMVWALLLFLFGVRSKP